MIATLVIFPFLSGWRAGWRIVICRAARAVVTRLMQTNMRCLSDLIYRTDRSCQCNGRRPFEDQHSKYCCNFSAATGMCL